MSAAGTRLNARRRRCAGLASRSARAGSLSSRACRSVPCTYDSWGGRRPILNGRRRPGRRGTHPGTKMPLTLTVTAAADNALSTYVDNHEGKLGRLSWECPRRGGTICISEVAFVETVWELAYFYVVAWSDRAEEQWMKAQLSAGGRAVSTGDSVWLAMSVGHGLRLTLPLISGLLTWAQKSMQRVGPRRPSLGVFPGRRRRAR
jgi:hypothetical protein